MDAPQRPSKNGFRLRDSDSADFHTLWRIDQQCFARGIAYSQRELAWYMAMRGAFTIVAERVVEGESAGDNNELAGFVVGQKTARGLGHIVTIDVLAEARRTGLGSLLMDAAEERLLSLGCAVVYLETAVDNQAALHFYKQRGYTVLKTIPRYYLDSIDALMMAKKLKKK